MEKFFTILAWIIAVPSTFAVAYQVIAVFVVFMTDRAKLTVGPKAIIPWLIFGVCWAWIFSH